MRPVQSSKAMRTQSAGRARLVPWTSPRWHCTSRTHALPAEIPPTFATRTPPVAEDIVENTVGAMDGLLQTTVHTLVPWLDGLTTVALTQVVAVLVVAVSGRILGWAMSAVVASLERQNRTSALNCLWGSLATTIARPMSKALPYLGYMVGFMRALTGLDNLHQYCLANRIVYSPWIRFWVYQIMDVTEPLCGFLAKVILAVTLASASWTLVLVKTQAFRLLAATLSSNLSHDEAVDMKRVLVPIDSLGTWLITAGGVLMCAMAFDVNLQPLLAVGSISGIIVGFASQEILLNLFSGISIFLTRPFVLGDQVELRSEKMVLKMATVVKIMPLRTVLLTEGNTLMLLPNRMVYGMVIVINRNDLCHRKLTSWIGGTASCTLTTEFDLPVPSNPDVYIEHAERVIHSITSRLATMKGLQQDSVKAYVAGYHNDRFTIAVSATGNCSEKMPFERLQQEFAFQCYRGRRLSAAV